MIRRVALGITLIAFIVGVFSTEATALRGRHSTTVTITSASESGGEMVVQGSLASNYRNCTRYRLVGLWPTNGGEAVDTALSDTYGNFTLRAPAEDGNYTVYAYREYAVGKCGHLCKIASTTFDF